MGISIFLNEVGSQHQGLVVVGFFYNLRQPSGAEGYGIGLGKEDIWNVVVSTAIGLNKPLVGTNFQLVAAGGPANTNLGAAMEQDLELGLCQVYDVLTDMRRLDIKPRYESQHNVAIESRL